MEVHAHTHSPRKKFTHYLWEFLMLFLAVFCGFLAENQREHLIEHQREKQFMISLLQDLRHDTAAFSSNLQAWGYFYANIDSQFITIQPPFQSFKTEPAYYRAALMYSFSEFNYNDRTIEQLRNSGNFRLIREKIVVDSLVDYDNIIRNQLRNQESVARNEMMTVLNQQNDLFNSKHVDEYAKGLYSPAKIPLQQLYRVENKPELLFRYYNQLYKYGWIAKVLIIENQKLKDQATGLIRLVKKEYHLSEGTSLGE